MNQKSCFSIHRFESTNQNCCFLIHCSEQVNRKGCFLILWSESILKKKVSWFFDSTELLKIVDSWSFFVTETVKLKQLFRSSCFFANLCLGPPVERADSITEFGSATRKLIVASHIASSCLHSPAGQGLRWTLQHYVK